MTKQEFDEAFSKTDLHSISVYHNETGRTGLLTNKMELKTTADTGFDLITEAELSKWTPYEGKLPAKALKLIYNRQHNEPKAFAEKHHGKGSESKSAEDSAPRVLTGDTKIRVRK